MATISPVLNIPNLAISLRVLARLLAYPDDDLLSDLPDMRAALRVEPALTAARKEELYALMRQLEGSDPLHNQSDFVELFDRGHSTSLHLFEHVHGDSRDRGPAMIDLTQTYEKAGLFLAPDELPDYLPVVLEFASTQPPGEARSFLGEIAHIVNVVFNALQQRRSRYASVLGALLEIAGEQATAVQVAADDELDATWAEPEVFDGCGNQGQGKAPATSSSHSIHFVKKDAAGARPGAL